MTAEFIEAFVGHQDLRGWRCFKCDKRTPWGDLSLQDQNKTCFGKETCGSPSTTGLDSTVGRSFCCCPIQRLRHYSRPQLLLLPIQLEWTNKKMKSGGSWYGDDSQVARGGGSGVGAHVVAWWGPGAYPWAVVLPVVVFHPNNWILHLGTLKGEPSHPKIGKNWHSAGQ